MFRYSHRTMTRGPHKQFDRDEVLDRAMQLFWSQGFEATGLTQLLEVMGIGRQSLYNTFVDKHGLYKECLRRYFEMRLQAGRTVLEGEGSPLGNIENLFEAMMDHTEQSSFCGCFIGNSLAEFGESDEEISRILAQFFEQVRGALERTLDKARDEGEISDVRSARDLSQFLLVVMQGLALLSKVAPSRELARGVVRTSLDLMSAPAARSATAS